jgi:sugar lactone lactonase YvrE
VVDSEGYLWNARWGGSCVVRHAPDGSIDRIIEVPVSQVTCPAFGGKDLKTLFITTAAKTLTPEQLAAEKVAGGVFAIEVDVAGLPETPIKL